VIDLTQVGVHDPRKFFRPIASHGGNANDARLTLEKDRFYILATKERVSIPVHLSAEMVSFLCDVEGNRQECVCVRVCVCV